MMRQKYTPMNPEWKEKWIAALRSGEYQQYHYSMDNASIGGKPTAFCCLGVLRDIMGDVKMNYPATGLDGAEDYLIILNDGCRPSAPEVILGKQHSFSEIADWIEENL